MDVYLNRFISPSVTLLLATSLLIITACSSGGGSDDPSSRTVEAKLQCVDIAKRDFDPTYMLENQPDPKRDLDRDGVVIPPIIH